MSRHIAVVSGAMWLHEDAWPMTLRQISKSGMSIHVYVSYSRILLEPINLSFLEDSGKVQAEVCYSLQFAGP